MSYYKLTETHFLQSGLNEEVLYRSKFQAIKIFDWLYSDTNYYLDRKYKKYLDVKRRLK